MAATQRRSGAHRTFRLLLAISMDGPRNGSGLDPSLFRGPATRSPAAPACRVATTEPTVQIYLPIADLPVNIFVILAIGLAVGFISGMFGIGGGFLMTPLLKSRA